MKIFYCARTSILINMSCWYNVNLHRNDCAVVTVECTVRSIHCLYVFLQDVCFHKCLKQDSSGMVVAACIVRIIIARILSENVQ